ncbi:beta-N-acetylhexosaminidase [Fulvivirgaceae bacterium BMA10]|uniref:beta-N-acetylhexosaminidase n=1 Tax=Splendidivirga corallicola TaxID=3051826 RepID=A0ABT8KM11_9BACT|nr:beta-N-acetylhexosaminidase [Fulvivirgaceae bacterium BMA10]
MKLKALLLLICTLGVTAVKAQKISIIPAPNNLEVKAGSFELSSSTAISHDDKTEDMARFLQQVIKDDTGLELGIGSKKQMNQLIHLKIISGKKDNKEAYSLEIDKNKISIAASDNQGLFYGIQSLRQLLLANRSSSNVIQLPVLNIDDQPRFSWRAFMLDESRYFKGMDQVKKLLDQMALLKMNVFHWHLTDDQGWRIEIKKYPALTEIGSKRTNSQIGGWGSEKRSGKPHGGFYTQEQIKEIVAYAKKRFITIVPEIEMPGHSSAAIASYPWLGTDGQKIEVPVVFGKRPDTYNVTDKKVYTFLTDVLDEVMQLFPSNVIHIGGDEVKYDHWKNSPTVNAYMKEHDLESPADLQIHFTNRISQYLESKGKRMMGWNEILGHNVHEYQKEEDTQVKTELAKGTIIHFWKGDLNLARTAIVNGYDIVNSLHSFTYLDYSHKSISLEKAYEFDPIPEGLEKKYHDKVIGVGCQMWGEWIPTVARMDEQIFPRIAAYAEVGWTSLGSKSFSDFSKSLKDLKHYWTQRGIGYTQ